jgi:putative Mn2+ efflux pump MntP
VDAHRRLAVRAQQRVSGGLFLAALSVGLSNFAASIGIGMSGVDARKRLRVGLAFGVFEAVMPVIGIVIGHNVSGSLGHVGRYLGGALLVATGLYTVWKSRREGDGEAAAGAGPLDTTRLLVTAFALSIDNLVVGFALGVYPVPALLAGIVVAATSVALSLIGLELGSRLGRGVEKWADEIGGAVLAAVGVALAFGVLS